MTDTEVLSLISEQLKIPKEQLTAAVSLMQSSQAEAQELRKKLQDFATKNADITFNTPSGSVTFPSLKKMDAATKAQQNAVNSFFTATAEYNYVDSAGVTRKVKPLALMANAIGYPWAMSKVQFEANRQQNLEKYEASGFVHFGRHYWQGSVNEGMTAWTGAWVTDPENKLWLGRNVDDNKAESESISAVISIAGVITDLESIGLDYNGDSRLTTVLLPPAEDGTRTYDSATGIPVRHATPALAFAAETPTNKVVTERVDTWGFEGLLRQINDADPFVYLSGLIQSRATSINGVATTDDNVRPITYFAWYEGDTTSRGRGVNWQTATEAQRIAIASDPKNNIYFDNATGKFYQWCVRGRSFAGLGNGDFSFVDPVQNSPMSFDSQNKSRIPVQGFNDTLGIVDSGSNFFASTSFETYNRNPHKGIFTAWSGSGYAINNECYFLVCGTVNRLNQGAYHPSLNPFGSAGFEGTNNLLAYWYSSSAPSVTHKSDCFTKVSSSFVPSGSMSRPDLTGRPDGRYYDAIYASGAGGVCRDMRYSAHGLSLEDLAEADLKVKSGEYRGVEKLKLTTIHTSPSLGSINHSANIKVVKVDANQVSNKSLIGTNALRGEVGQNLGYYLVANGVVYPVSYSYHQNDNEFWVYIESTLTIADGVQVYLIRSDEIITSISGEYTHTDVIGDPANILLCDVLKDGWVGSWIPDIPDGVKDDFMLTKPYSGSDSDITRTYTNNNGIDWTSSKILLSSPTTNESVFTDMPSTQVTLYHYITKARMTGQSDNQTPYKVSDTVFVSARSHDKSGRHLGYSLTGNINKSLNASSLGADQSHYSVKKYQMGDGLDKLIGLNAIFSTHEPIDIISPTSGDSAFKALSYFTQIKGQTFICYTYAELIYDSVAGNWGDDGQVHIVDGQSTIIDLNGHTANVGTAIIVEPIGWIKKNAA